MKLTTLIAAIGCLAAFYSSSTGVEARFGQENKSTLGQIGNCAPGSPGQISGQLATFAGQGIGTLLAAAGACAQQDQADKIISFAKDNNLPQTCIDLAVSFRQAEKNVNPFAVKNPCSAICDRLPQNPELLGSVQAFDPACNLQQFFADNPDQKKNFDLQKGAATGGAANNNQGGAAANTEAPAAATAAPATQAAATPPDCANVVITNAPTAAAAQQQNNQGNNNDGAAAGGAAAAGAAVQCNAKKLEVIVQGRENRFGFDGRQVALNPAIPIENICQQVNAACKATCDAAKAAAIATGVKGFQDSDPAKLKQMGELADTFNAALGNKSNFAALGGDAAGAATGNAGAAGGGAQACNAQQLEVIVKGRENRFGLDGQQVALNPAIPIDRICQKVSAGCKATCDAAKAAAVASGVKGFQDSDPAKLKAMGELADTFNAALGNKSNFAAVAGNQGARSLRAN